MENAVVISYILGYSPTYSVCKHSSSSCCALSGPPDVGDHSAESIPVSRQFEEVRDFVRPGPVADVSQPGHCLLPTPRRPSIFPSIINRRRLNLSPRITWPKYESFRTFIHLRSSLSVFAVHCSSRASHRMINMFFGF